MELSTYAERLALAMGGDPQPSSEAVHALADRLDLTYQAVKKVLKGDVPGGSKAFTAENNSFAAAALSVDPDWLATGRGEMRSQRVWPFGSAITPAEFFSLDLADVQPAIDVLRAAIARGASKGKPPLAA